MADALLGREAVAHGVLDERLHREVGHGDRQHLGRDEQGDLEPLAEAGLLEHEVALDVAQLLGQRGERAARAQRVAGEVGEVDEQLAGPVGVGAHERGDRGEAVVDEVRADLGAQRPQLGLHDAGAGAGELGEGELAGHPRGDLLGGLRQPGEGCSVQALSVPTMSSSMTSGAVTALRIGQLGSVQAIWVEPWTTVRPLARVSSPRSNARCRWCSPAPVHDSTLPVSAIETAWAPRMDRRWRPARSAASGVRPSPRYWEARDAVCSVA